MTIKVALLGALAVASGVPDATMSVVQIASVAGALLFGGGGLAAWYRVRKVEEPDAALNVVKSALEGSKFLHESAVDEVRRLREEVAELRKEVERLRLQAAEVHDLRQQVTMLEGINAGHIKSLEKLRAQLDKEARSHNEHHRTRKDDET